MRLLFLLLEKIKTLISIYLNGIHNRNLVIATRSRSGSNVLKSLLNQSKDIVMQGEVFGKVSNYKNLKKLKNRYIKSNSMYKIKGFKFFYYHPTDLDVSWNYFFKDIKDIKILILVRQNLFKTEISRQQALQDGVWINHFWRKKKKLYKYDFEDVYNNICLTIKRENSFIDYCNKNNLTYKVIVYEDLVRNIDKEMANVMKFLDLDISTKFNNYHKKSNSVWTSTEDKLLKKLNDQTYENRTYKHYF